MWCFRSANFSFTQDGLHIAQISAILPCELIFVIPALHCSPPSTWEYETYTLTTHRCVRKKSLYDD